jgi:hypothetical protein
MNVNRLLATSVTTCAVGLSLAACSVGISSASPGTSPSPSPAASHAASSAAASHSTSASASPSHSPADTVSVDTPFGSFPIPHGAQLEANMSCGKQQVLLELDSVTPVQAATFYTSALPQAGYNITENNLSADPDTGAPQGMAEISFTGHSYTGLIIAIANLDSGPSSAGLPSNDAKNSVEISLAPAGTAISSQCP